MLNFLRVGFPEPTSKPGLEPAQGRVQIYTANGEPVSGLISIKLECAEDRSHWRATLVMEVNVSGKPD